MKLKDYLLLMGWLYALLVVGGCLLFATSSDQSDTFGRVAGVCMLVFFMYKSFMSFQGLQVVRQEDIAFAPPTDATEQEQIIYCKKILWLSSVAFPALSIWICLDLNRLESGSTDSVSIWEPVALLYETFGYWVAVLAVPIFGIFVFLSLFKKVFGVKKPNTPFT